MGAALLVMVASLTLGRKRYESVQEEAARIRSEAESLLRMARRLAEDDAEAYGRVSAALQLPRESEQDRAERQRRIQETLKTAVGPPLETMRVAARVVQLADELVEIGNRSAISDVGSALLSARAGYLSARLNVETNLSSIRDQAWVAQTREAMAAMPDTEEVERRAVPRVEAIVRGEPG